MKTDFELDDQETKQRVFISYSRKDINFARRLAGDLEKAGFDVWWDISDLKGGDDWVRIIPAMIKQCNIPFALNTINYVNFTTDDYETGLKNC